MLSMRNYWFWLACAPLIHAADPKDFVACSGQEVEFLIFTQAVSLETKFAMVQADLKLLVDSVVYLMKFGGMGEYLTQADLCSPRAPTEFIGYHDCNPSRTSELYVGNTALENRHGNYGGNWTIDVDLQWVHGFRSLVAEFVERQRGADGLSFYDGIYLITEGNVVSRYPGFNVGWPGPPTPLYFGDAVSSEANAYRNPWFSLGRPMNNPTRKSVWTPPLYDFTTDVTMMTAILPIYMNGSFRGHDFTDTFMGVVGIDVLQDRINPIVASLMPTKNSLPMIVDSNGYIVAAPDKVCSVIWGRSITLTDTIGCVDSAAPGTEQACSITSHQDTGDWVKLMNSINNAPGEVRMSFRDFLVIDSTGKAVPHLVVFYRWVGEQLPDWASVVLVPQAELESAAKWVMPDEISITEESPEVAFKMENPGTIDLLHKVVRYPPWMSIERTSSQSAPDTHERLTAGGAGSFKATYIKDSMKPGRYVSVLVFEVLDDGYPDCEVAQEVSINVALFIPEPPIVWVNVLIYGGTAIGIVALMMFIGWIARRIMRKRRLAIEKEVVLSRKVADSLRLVGDFAFPMAVMRATDFLALNEDQLQFLHEGQRNLGNLVFLDTFNHVASFRADGNRTIFFSYEFLSFTAPGPNDVQRKCMNHTIELYCAKERIDVDDVYIWLDILCIPQFNMKSLAIDSLYSYAASVDAMVIIAPESFHTGKDQPANLTSYNNRVWCRVEQLAYTSNHGIDSAFFYESTGLVPITEDYLSDVVRVFEAESTCCIKGHVGGMACDRERLVMALVACWFRLSVGHNRGIGTVAGSTMLYKLIEPQKDTVFPAFFNYTTPDGVYKKELFGDLIARVDKRISAMSDKELADAMRVTETVLVSPSHQFVGRAPKVWNPVSAI